MKVIVVGAGIGGLATAVRLASSGHQVSVFESAGYPGGKLSSFEKQGFRFDRGPSLFTMPTLLEDLFRKAGKPIGNYFEYQTLNESCRYFFANGNELIASTHLSQLALEVENKFKVPADVFLRHLDRSSFFYKTLAPVFLEVSLNRPRHLFKKDFFKALLRMPFLGLFSTMDGFNKKHLKNEQLVQFFNRYATYNGSDPYQAPATLHIIPHLEHKLGTFFPKGGMVAITNALHQLALDLGVEFQFNTRVEEVLVEEKKAVGIVTSGKIIQADLVVSNVDIYYSYTNLLKAVPAPQRLIHQPKSSSALVFYWGIRKIFPKLGLHNVFFSADYKREFQTIKEGKNVFEDPTIYINITSKHNPKDAPEGMENWFVMVNVPNHQGQDWQTIQQSVKRNLIKRLSNVLGEDIESLIATEHVWNPPEIESMTGSFAGALYGNSSNNRMAAFLRHPNFSKKIKGLYFCGGSVHPGGGIPLCLQGAAIVERCISEDYPHA
jgi:phytoene desaturase